MKAKQELTNRKNNIIELKIKFASLSAKVSLFLYAYFSS